MKIDVKPRSYFEEIKGTPTEMEILATHRVISIVSSNGDDTEPPFSQEALASPTRLCMVFDDVIEDADEQFVKFSEADAKAILDFICDDSMPVIVHCSAGIARSGAVGEALDSYYNCFRTQNDEDHQCFLRHYQQRLRPNSLVKRLLMREIYARSVENISPT